MGPTNLALVKLFQADQKLREAQSRLESVTRGVRYQERKIKELTEKLQAAQAHLREQQSQAAQLDLDLKSRDAHIEKLRAQQQQTKNNREYQAFLVEINTEKVDRNKVEDQVLKAMEGVEQTQAQVKDLTAQLEGEQARLVTMQQEIGARGAAVQAEVEQLRPARQQAAAAVPAQARETFERLAERFDGEAMAAIGKPNRRREEYVCQACNMSLVADMYNRLHVRDEPIFCPSCRRMLYIPEDLPLEEAIRPPRKESKPRTPKAKNVGATIGRQTSAADVLASMRPEAETPQAEALPQEQAPAQSNAPAAEAEAQQQQ